MIDEIHLINLDRSTERLERFRATNRHLRNIVRFPGVDGSAYFVGGMGVNYQRAEDITLAPIRAGVGFRLGANVGYLSYSRKRNLIPF